MKNVVAILSVVFSASAFNTFAEEVPQQLQQAFSAPGPAGKVTVQISSECRGKLIYEAQDFIAETYAHPNSSGNAYFSADIPNANPIYGYFYTYSTGDKQNFSIKKGKLNFNAQSKNPHHGGNTSWIMEEDMKNICCKNG